MKERRQGAGRAKQLLEESLLQLMQDKNIKRITVRELTAHAGINRSTFYLHYMDIYDMVEQLEQRLIYEFYQELNSDHAQRTIQEDVYYFMTVVFSFLKKNRRMVLILCGENGDRTFMKRLSEITRSQASVWIHSLLGEHAQKDQEELAASFFCSGCVAMVYSWILHDETMDQQKVLELMFQLVRKGAYGFVAEGEIAHKDA
ncbi:MAG: TetR-like C-terminal domain-containing protein [Ruminococcus sp.]